MNAIALLEIVGILTVIISILVKVLGFPDQIRNNYLRKSTSGLSFYLILLIFLSYILWFLYGTLKKDMVLIIPNVVGIITSGIVLFQVVNYRKSK